MSYARHLGTESREELFTEAGLFGRRITQVRMRFTGRMRANRSSYTHCMITQSGLLRRGSVQRNGVPGRRIQSCPVCRNGCCRSMIHTSSRDTRHSVTANVTAEGMSTYPGSRESAMSAATSRTSAAPGVTSTTPTRVAATSTAASTSRDGASRHGCR